MTAEYDLVFTSSLVEVLISLLSILGARVNFRWPFVVTKVKQSGADVIFQCLALLHCLWIRTKGRHKRLLSLACSLGGKQIG